MHINLWDLAARVVAGPTHVAPPSKFTSTSQTPLSRDEERGRVIFGPLNMPPRAFYAMLTAVVIVVAMWSFTTTLRDRARYQWLEGVTASRRDLLVRVDDSRIDANDLSLKARVDLHH